MILRSVLTFDDFFDDFEYEKCQKLSEIQNT